MIKFSPKQLSLLFLILGITISTGCGSDNPEKKVPNHIVSIGNKPGVGDVLMNINVKKGSVASYELTNDLNILGTSNCSMNEITQQAEFVILNNPKYELLTYTAKTDDIERVSLNINKSDYYWNYGVSSNDYVALRGVELENTDDSFVTIVDRETNTSKVLLACEDCYGGSANYSPMIIQGDLLYTIFLTNTLPYLAVFELSTQQKIYGVELSSYPYMVTSKDYIYLFDPASSTMQAFDNKTLDGVGSYSLQYFLNLGLNGSTDDKAVVYQLFAQPSLVSAAPQVIDLNTGEVINGFSYNDLVGNREEFSERTGLALSSPADIAYLDLNRNFVLYSGAQYGESANEYVYILSNYSSVYRDHISLPFQPEEVIAVSWK